MLGRVLLCGPLPTPAVAQLTVSMRADAGMVISASHNPHADNGIKVFAADGYKLPDAVEAEIEAEEGLTESETEVETPAVVEEAVDLADEDSPPDEEREAPEREDLDLARVLPTAPGGDAEHMKMVSWASHFSSRSKATLAALSQVGDAVVAKRILLNIFTSLARTVPEWRGS